jgi:hypothetical protein
MCDYSLHAVQSRPAKAGDLLIMSTFANTFTRGFSAVAEPGIAVCLLPGTELAFSEDAMRNHPFAAMFPRMRFGCRSALDWDPRSASNGGSDSLLMQFEGCLAH